MSNKKVDYNVMSKLITIIYRYVAIKYFILFIVITNGSVRTSVERNHFNAYK